MVEPNHTPARQDFARRLRELRLPRGFKTARSLARALEIDENRYTRYERAEVEPDLALIRRICEILDVTPNDLLGAPGASADAASTTGPDDRKGLGTTTESRGMPPADEGAASAFSVRIDSAAWSLACAVAELKRSDSTDTVAQPLAVLQRATRFYKGLKAQPFETISEIVRDPTVAGAEPKKADHLCGLIGELTAALRQSTQPE